MKLRYFPPTTAQTEETTKTIKKWKKKLKKMQQYSDTLSGYLTTDNLQKVDTIVGIVETLYSAYSAASGFIGLLAIRPPGPRRRYGPGRKALHSPRRQIRPGCR